jgi:hypothetical protein
MPKKRPLTDDSIKRLCASIRVTYSDGLIVRSFLASHFNKDKEIRQRWEAVLEEISRIANKLSD